MIEREIKLRFESPDAARHAIRSSGLNLTLREGRRLQRDALLDTDDNQLYRRGSALRVRRDDGRVGSPGTELEFAL